MSRYLILALIILVPWFGTTVATEDKDGALTICECLKVSREDSLWVACKGFYESIPSTEWSVEADACKEKEMRVLADHIRECSEIMQEFIHPWTGNKLMRAITGMENGTCHYIVQLPQGGKMECRFPPNRLDDIAYYFENSTRFEKAQIKISTTLVDGKEVTKTRYFIDGEEVINPMQESLDNGECVTHMPQT